MRGQTVSRRPGGAPPHILPRRLARALVELGRQQTPDFARERIAAAGLLTPSGPRPRRDAPRDTAAAPAHGSPLLARLAHVKAPPLPQPVRVAS